MENNESRPSRVTAQRALEVWVAVCVILVLLILYGAFVSARGGTVAGEVYVRTGMTTSIGK